MTKVGLLVEGKRGERRTTSPKSPPRPTGKPSDYRKEFFVWLGDARWLIHLLPLNVPFGGAPPVALPCNGWLGVPVHCRNEPSQVATSSIAALGTPKWSADTVTNLLLAWGGALSKM